MVRRSAPPSSRCVAAAGGLDAIGEFRANPRDATPLKHARAHVHQAAGAIQALGANGHRDLASGGELHGVREEIPDHLLQAPRIAGDRAHAGHERGRDGDPESWSARNAGFCSDLLTFVVTLAADLEARPSDATSRRWP